MPGLRVVERTAAVWGLPDAVPGVLHAAGAFGLPEPAAGGRDARSHRTVQGRAWPGHSCGVRRPAAGETPLSFHEVAFAVREGLL